MNWDEFKSKKLSDEGSRYLHYSELISVWEEAADIITRSYYIGKENQAKLDSLKSAVELIRNTMDGMSEYQDTVLSLRRLVDLIPHDILWNDNLRTDIITRQMLEAPKKESK